MTTAAETTLFAPPTDEGWIEVAPGNRRRVLVYTEGLMQVEFAFEKGAIGYLHSHPHVQSSYVAEGSFEVTIDGKKEVITAGGSFIVPSGLEHGVVALEPGRLIDCFTPIRQDFL